VRSTKGFDAGDRTAWREGLLRVSKTEQSEPAERVKKAAQKMEMT